MLISQQISSSFGVPRSPVTEALGAGRLREYSHLVWDLPEERNPFSSYGSWPTPLDGLGVIVVLVLATLRDLTHVGNAVYLRCRNGGERWVAQWLIARKWFDATSRWIWASTIGITTPFLYADLFRMGDLSSFVLPVLAAVGGLLSGLMQRNGLRSHSAKAERWVVVSALAWMCPALLVQFVAVPRHPRTTLESLRNIGSVGLGGVALGAITGAALVWLLNVRERSASA